MAENKIQIGHVPNLLQKEPLLEINVHHNGRFR